VAKTPRTEQCSRLTHAPSTGSSHQPLHDRAKVGVRSWMDSSSPNAAWDLTLLEQQPRMTMAKFALLVAATSAVVLVVVDLSRIHLHALQSLCWVLVLSPATVFLTVWQSSLGLVIAMGLPFDWTCRMLPIALFPSPDVYYAPSMS
jgi:hypothetical protein